MGSASERAGRTAIVAGATGLVGGHLVSRLAADPAYARVIALSRRPLGSKGEGAPAGVEFRQVDFERLAETAGPLEVDDAFCALGTTIRAAGSQAAFSRVDRFYVEAFADLVRPSARRFALVSAMGADPGSRIFYARIKGEAEAAVVALGFESTLIFRPSYLVGARAEFRPLERLGIAGARVLSRLPVPALRRARPVPARDVADAMVRACLEARPGVRVFESDEI